MDGVYRAHIKEVQGRWETNYVEGFAEDGCDRDDASCSEGERTASAGEEYNHGIGGACVPTVHDCDSDEESNSLPDGADDVTRNGSSREHTPRHILRRAETRLKLLLTVRHAAPADLGAVLGVLAGCIRKRFTDSSVKVLDVSLESERQAPRERRRRYMAWGPGAVRDRTPSQGGQRTSLSPVILSLLVYHRSDEELAATTRSLVECVCGNFPEGVVQWRATLPALQGACHTAFPC